MQEVAEITEHVGPDDVAVIDRQLDGRGLARAFADVCSLGLRLQSARRSAELQQEAVAMTQRLEQAGRASSIDVARAARVQSDNSSARSAHSRRNASPSDG